MDNGMTAERAFEWLLANVRGNDSSNKMPMNSQLRNQLADMVRQVLTSQKVPPAWRTVAENAIKFATVEMVKAYPITAAEQIKGLASLLLTAAPAPAEPAQDELAKLRERVKVLADDLDWSLKTIEWLSAEDSKGGITTCKTHHGHGFKTDCAICIKTRLIAARLRGGSDE